MPNRRFAASVVLNSVLVMKFALLACSDGTAWMTRNRAISAIAPMMVAPAAKATEPKTRSPNLPPPFKPDFGITVDTMIEVCPERGGPTGAGEPTTLGSGLIVIELRESAVQTYEIALTAVDSFSLKESGTGMYPLSVNPSWPLPSATLRNAFTAVATSASGYFEQTTE